MSIIVCRVKSADIGKKYKNTNGLFEIIADTILQNAILVQIENSVCVFIYNDYNLI